MLVIDGDKDEKVPSLNLQSEWKRLHPQTVFLLKQGTGHLWLLARRRHIIPSILTVRFRLYSSLSLSLSHTHTHSLTLTLTLTHSLTHSLTHITLRGMARTHTIHVSHSVTHIMPALLDNIPCAKYLLWKGYPENVNLSFDMKGETPASLAAFRGMSYLHGRDFVASE